MTNFCNNNQLIQFEFYGFYVIFLRKSIVNVLSYKYEQLISLYMSKMKENKNNK